MQYTSTKNTAYRLIRALAVLAVASTLATNGLAATYSITPNPASVNENGGHLTFTITRSSSLGTATVYTSTVTDQGYSNPGGNYYYLGLVNQTVNFSSGQSSAQVSVAINDLGLTSGSETFRFIVQQNATDPVSTYLATDNFTITNNDTGTGVPAHSTGLDARDTGIAAYAKQLKAAGYNFIGQYIGNEAGYLTSDEAAEIQGAGLQLFSIYEKSGMSDTDGNGGHTYAWETYFSSSQGAADASRAYTAATGARQPFGSAIYFAVDLDPSNTDGITETEALDEIAQYFQGVQNYFSSLPSASSYTIGVYGAGDTLTRIMGDGLAKYSWLASPSSWSGFSIWYPPGATSFEWNLHQVTNLPAQPQYGNIQIDTDETSGVPFGAWNEGARQPAQELTVAGISTNGLFSFNLNGLAGSNYVIQVSSNLTDWASVVTNTIPAGGVRVIDFPVRASQLQVFYRAARLSSGRLVLQPGPVDGKDIWTTSVYSYAQCSHPGPGGGLNDISLRVGGWGDFYNSLIEFDLSALPTNATSAVLYLYCYGLSGGGTPMYLDRITSFWDWRTQGTGCDRLRLWWADRPSATQWAANQLATPTQGQWYAVDITTLYNGWQNGTYPNYGIQFRPVSNSNNNFDNFYSADYTADPTLRPKLVITAGN